MNGLHLIGDLYDCRCPPERLLDAPALETYCVDACGRHGLTVVGRLFHPFADAAGRPAGVTGTVVLAESHLAIHTWPEIAGVTLDVYVCNYRGDNSDKARALFAEIVAGFAAERRESHALDRGDLAAAAGRHG